MPIPPKAADNPAKIYLLPNLMTAGNLIFGFLAVLKIVEGSIHQAQGGSGLGVVLRYQHSLHPGGVPV